VQIARPLAFTRLGRRLRSTVRTGGAVPDLPPDEPARNGFSPAAICETAGSSNTVKWSASTSNVWTFPRTKFPHPNVGPLRRKGMRASLARTSTMRIPT
jgi:hypothetical protein